MAMRKIMVALPHDMVKILEKERKDRYLETIPETIRVILSEYLRTKVHSKCFGCLSVKYNLQVTGCPSQLIKRF